MTRQIGFLGLGQMGKPMALNLVKAGFRVLTCPHRREAPVEELVAAGAIRKATPAEVAAEAEIVVLCLPDPPAVQDLLAAPDGLLAGLRPGTVVVDCGTSGLAVTRQAERAAAEKGAAWLDAPISGGVWGARAGTLTIMVGGDAAALERARPVLEAMGERIVHVGASGNGQVTKLVNNLMACINTATVGEAFSLGVKAGIPVEALHEVVSHSSGSNWVLENAAPRTIFAGNYQPGGRLRTMTKDLLLVEEIAKDLRVPLFLGSLVTQLHQTMMVKGHGDDDAGIVAHFYEELLGLSLASPAFEGQGE